MKTPQTARIDWKALTNGQIERLVDKGLRHKSGSKPVDYLNHFLSVSRQFGYATHDDSWGEFEKEFAIIISRLVSAERALESRPAQSGGLREAWELVEIIANYPCKTMGESGLALKAKDALKLIEPYLQREA